MVIGATDDGVSSMTLEECSKLRDEIAARDPEVALYEPDGYLDYDPLPNELALRASYARQGFIARGILEESNNEVDTLKTGPELFDHVSSVKNSNITKDD